MKYLIVIFIFSLLLFIGGMVFVFPQSFEVCERGRDYSDCIDQYDKYETQGALVALLAPVLFFTSVVVYSYKNKPAVFHSWLRFSKYYLPIAAVLILLSPATDSSILGFDKEFITWLFAGIYFIASLGIIVFKRRTITQ